MKISARQVRAAVDAYLRDRAVGVGRLKAGALSDSPKENEDALRRVFDRLPEERDIVVHELRAKVRKGSYFISSKAIVEALLGRLAAGLTTD